MAWKLMMSYEKENGIVQIMGSKDVVRHAMAMTLIDNGEAWLDMIDARNKTAHVYDDEMAIVWQSSTTSYTNRTYHISLTP